ncbi:MAG: 50S ribosomal protein L22 [Bacteroidales bacterium]|nr:50S ribosomal protein L22 [Bacteroidales bacterium]MBR5650860.1 50S ribosomal protein L22 [Bacteroidales bacterium]MBR5720520.1 50S ribosomal protein L22 [Bacteroidales bacterium]
MGSRKHKRAEMLKEAKRTQYFASLNDCPSSPQKMRLVANMVRGVDVDKALYILKYSSKEASKKVYKLLRSAIANWQFKNEGARIDDAQLYIKEIIVNEGRTLKRIQPAPQGRAHRILKRSNHVTVILDSRSAQPVAEKTDENN